MADTKILKGFGWTMVGTVEGPKAKLTPGTVVEISTRAGKVQHVTIGAVIEEFEKVGTPFVRCLTTNTETVFDPKDQAKAA